MKKVLAVLLVSASVVASSAYGEEIASVPNPQDVAAVVDARVVASVLNRTSHFCPDLRLKNQDMVSDYLETLSSDEGTGVNAEWLHRIAAQARLQEDPRMEIISIVGKEADQGSRIGIEIHYSNRTTRTIYLYKDGMTSCSQVVER